MTAAREAARAAEPAERAASPARLNFWAYRARCKELALEALKARLEAGSTGRIGETVRPICDRFWMFSIAGLSLGVVAIIAISIVRGGAMPDGAGELLASMVTGLLLIVQKVIDAQAQRRTLDHLALSRPASANDNGTQTQEMDVQAENVTVRRSS